MNIPLREELIRVAKKYGWNQDIVQLAWGFQYVLGIGLLAESKYKSLGDCQLVVTLAEDNQGPYFQITLRTELEKGDVEELSQNIRQMSDLRTIFHKV